MHYGPMSYYRLGQSYPRTRLRESHGYKRDYFQPWMVSRETPPVDSPDDVPGINFWIKATEGVYSDFDLSTPAVDGDTLGRWDSSVGGYHLFNIGSVANRPIYNTTGTPGLIWDYWRPLSAGDTRLGNFKTDYPSSRQAISGLIVVRLNSSDTRVNLLSFGAATGHNFSIYVQHGTLRIWDGTSVLDSGLKVPSRRCVIVFRASASGIALYIDTPANTVTVAAAPAGTFAGGTVGEGFPGFTGGWFELHELALWPSDIGAGNAADMLAYGRSAYSIATSYSRRFLFADDSLTIGFGAVRNQNYWSVAGLPATDDIFSTAIAGQTLADFTADAAEVYAVLQAHAAPWLVLRIGANDLNTGGNGTTLCNSLVTACNAAKAAVPNLKIVLATSSIRPAGMTESDNAAVITQQAAFNALLRADFTLPTQTLYGFSAGPGVTYADRLMDFAADPQVGISLSPDPVYRIAGDTIHLTTAGQFVEGGILYYTLLDPPVVAPVPTGFWIPEDRGTAFVPGHRGTRFVVQDRPTAWSAYDR